MSVALAALGNAQAMGEIFTGSAAVRSASGNVSETPMAFTIERKMPKSEVDALLAAFQAGGAAGLRKALVGVAPTGAVRVGAAKPVPSRLTFDRTTARRRQGQRHRHEAAFLRRRSGSALRVSGQARLPPLDRRRFHQYNRGTMIRLSLARLLASVAMAATMALADARPALAQTALPPVAVPPVNVMLPNYNSVPVGEIGGLEAGAFVVRANDSSAIFYNPAGLILADRSSISGSAGVMQFDTVTATGLLHSGTSFQNVPAMFGVVVKDVFGHPGWAGGLSLARINAWAQGVAGERAMDIVTGTNRVSYASSANMDGWLASIGFGYRATDRLRLGGSLDGQLTQTQGRQRLGDQNNSGATLSALLVEAQGSAWASHLRLTVGGQYDLTPRVQLGTVIRTAGLGVLSGGSASLEGVSQAGTTTTTASFFDADQSVEYKVPMEFKAGAAYKFARGAVEFDLLTHLGAGVYDAVTSVQPTTVLRDSGAGTVSRLQLATSPRVVDSRAVVNLAVGGHYNLTADGRWVVHGGYATDRSPVGDADTEFTRIHLQKLTVGLSGRTSLFLGSLGLQYSGGSSDTLLLKRLPNGQPLTTSFKVANLGFVYSLSLLF